MEKLKLMKGTFYYLIRDTIQFQIRKLGSGCLTQYEVSVFSIDYQTLSKIDSYTEREFKREWLQ